MKESQIVIFCNEINRLQRDNDTLTASNQILQDAISIMQADHAVEVARVKAEMAPGFSWPDPDMAQQMSSKLDDAQVYRVKMAQKTAQLIRARNRALAELNALRGQHANRNTATKNAYNKRRSQVNKEIKKIEAEIADEFEMDSGCKAIDDEQAQNGATERTGGPTESHTGCSHSN